MNSDEEVQILNYLKANEATFFSPAEIARRASPRLFRVDKAWAFPCLLRLNAAGAIESDPAGHYRYVDSGKKKHQQKEEEKKQEAVERPREKW